MREIKQAAGGGATRAKAAAPSPPPLPTATSATPPFEPDLFSSNWAQDRRRHPRIKCFVAVELRVNDGDVPIWGNLSNTSMGGCQVETAAQISGGAKVEIGLWVASGKIWVKGLALNGVVTRSAPAGGVRIRFAGMEPAGRRESPPVSEICSGNHPCIEQREQLLATVKVEFQFLFSPRFSSKPGNFHSSSDIIPQEIDTLVTELKPFAVLRTLIGLASRTTPRHRVFPREEYPSHGSQ